MELLREVYADWARGDFTREVFGQRVEYAGEGWVEGPAWRLQGRDEAVSTLTEWLSQWRYPATLEAEEFIDAGDAVVVLVRFHGVGKASGVELDARYAHVWWLRGGLAVRFHVYRDRDQAFAAAGIEGSERGARR